MTPEAEQFKKVPVSKSFLTLNSLATQLEICLIPLLGRSCGSTYRRPRYGVAA